MLTSWLCFMAQLSVWEESAVQVGGGGTGEANTATGTRLSSRMHENGEKGDYLQDYSV